MSLAGLNVGAAWRIEALRRGRWILGWRGEQLAAIERFGRLLDMQPRGRYRLVTDSGSIAVHYVPGQRRLPGMER